MCVLFGIIVFLKDLERELADCGTCSTFVIEHVVEKHTRFPSGRKQDRAPPRYLALLRYSAQYITVQLLPKLAGAHGPLPARLSPLFRTPHRQMLRCR